ncbi:hypothetical protein CJA_0381 [Cellvibrio japonicus Ueda107]|uniref:Uncharacterized protein n=1 Tax=Cellvibrio japonicus (strain Ueda107) TaxID=498211 RepID=B3PI42_CELJU|nr:hypothetical protein CJA_0381 [Cellvibrio japonicus Ueda107]
MSLSHSHLGFHTLTGFGPQEATAADTLSIVQFSVIASIFMTIFKLFGDN